MIKFIHAADVHLDSPLRGLERYEGAPVERIRHATRRALANLVNLALDERVQLVLIAGDIYDGDWEDYHTGLFFTKEMARLRDANIPVVLIAGNHDAQSRMTRALRLPDNVKQLPTDRPDTVRFQDLGIAVHGQGFATQQVYDDLSLHYPRPLAGYFNIGLLHTSLTGAEGHDSYAPTTVEQLKSKHYDYWALGHVHQSKVWCREPWIAFPGNIQGRHIRETGPRGCLLVTAAPGEAPQAEARSLDVMRWELCTLDATDAADADEVQGRFSTALQQLLAQHPTTMPLAVRIQVTGVSRAHDELVGRQVHWTHQFRNCANLNGRERVWVEKVQFQTRPQRAAAEVPADGPLAEIHSLLQELPAAPSSLLEISRDLQELLKKLPPEFHDGGAAALKWEDPLRLAEMLSEVGPLLAGRLAHDHL